MDIHITETIHTFLADSKCQKSLTNILHCVNKNHQITTHWLKSLAQQSIAVRECNTGSRVPGSQPYSQFRNPRSEHPPITGFYHLKKVTINNNCSSVQYQLQQHAWQIHVRPTFFITVVRNHYPLQVYRATRLQHEVTVPSAQQ